MESNCLKSSHRNGVSVEFYLESGADLLKLSRDDIIQICGPADGIRLFNTLRLRSIRPRLTIYMCQEPTQGKEKEDCQDSPNAAMCVYKEIYLEDLTKAELTNKLAALFSISPSQILQIYRQGAAGIHILVGDQMIRNLPDESSFIINSLKVDSLGGYYMILK
ncbi:hypothetical protein chiPu_0014583 [Chiloscyllium punctatum]|uniref:Uncharacterized protein n=1 Tax=Chiloscyllium punctatum TaxID=137246 RepID=A0A401T0E2_CHIPU|nr:hypothetical protein [Chiloscyllium punctatum]